VTAATLRLDLEQCRIRTRRTMTASVVLHALLFLWITTIKPSDIVTPPITEITMLTPGDLAAAEAGPAAPAPRVAPQPGLAARKVDNDVRFLRREDRGDIALDPVSPVSIADQMAARLPDARVVVVAGAGHAAQLERPDEVAAAIRDTP